MKIPVLSKVNDENWDLPLKLLIIIVLATHLTGYNLVSASALSLGPQQQQHPSSSQSQINTQVESLSDPIILSVIEDPFEDLETTTFKYEQTEAAEETTFLDDDYPVLSMNSYNQTQIETSSIAITVNVDNVTNVFLTIDTPHEVITTTEETTSTILATTATNTEPVPSDQEKLAQSILDETNSTIQSTQHFLYKQKTHVSLNLLNSIIPLLKNIKSNMTSLLLATGEAKPDFGTFIQAENELENELSHVKDRMVQNKLLVQRYSTAYSNAGRELKTLHETLQSILLPDLPSVSETPVTTKLDPLQTDTDTDTDTIAANPTLDSTTEMTTILNTATNNDDTSETVRQTDELMMPLLTDNSDFHETLMDPFFTYLLNISATSRANRLVAYSHALQIFNRILPIDGSVNSKSSLYFRLAYRIHQDPDLISLRTNLTDQVRELVSDEDKTLTSRSTFKSLAIGSRYIAATFRRDYVRTVDPINTTSGGTGTGTGIGTASASAQHSYWRFHPIEDGKYFVLGHTAKGKAVGMERTIYITRPSDTANIIELRTLADALNPTAHEYHWKIHLVYVRDDIQFIKLINRKTNLDLATDEVGRVYPYTTFDYINRDWKLSS